MHILCKLYLAFGDTESPRHRGHLRVSRTMVMVVPQAKAGWLDFHRKIRVKKQDDDWGYPVYPILGNLCSLTGQPAMWL